VSGLKALPQFHAVLRGSDLWEGLQARRSGPV